VKRIACSVFTDDKAERNEEIEDNPFPMLSKDPLELLVLKEETLRLNIPNKLSILRIFSQNTDTYLIYATQHTKINNL
jgi:hypothetical protein